MSDNKQLEISRRDKALEQQAKEWVGSLGTYFGGLTHQQRLRLGLVVLAVVACMAGLIWYGASPDWRILYAGLEAQDAREMAVQLTAAGIPFDVSPDGSTLRVSADVLDKARL